MSFMGPFVSSQGPGVARQVQSVRVTEDNSCTAEEDCTTLNITTTGNSRIIILASAHAQVSGAGGGAFFKFKLDGVALDGEMVARAVSANGSGSAAYVRDTGSVSAGVHTVLVTWRPSATQTATLTVTGGSHHMHMTLVEVTL